MKKILKIVLYAFVIIGVGYLRLGFPGKSLIENDAVLYTETVKIANGINPFPQFTFKWATLFLTGYYGWFLTDLRVLIHYFYLF